MKKFMFQTRIHVGKYNHKTFNIRWLTNFGPSESDPTWRDVKWPDGGKGGADWRATLGHVGWNRALPSGDWQILARRNPTRWTWRDGYISLNISEFWIIFGTEQIIKIMQSSANHAFIKRQKHVKNSVMKNTFNGRLYYYV